MDERFVFLIFFGMILGVLFLIHYYIFIRLTGLLSLNPKITAIIMGILWLSFPLMNVLERAINNGIIRWLYAASSTWIGLMFYLLVLLGIFELINLGLKLAGITVNAQLAGIVILTLSVLITVYGLINAQNIKVKEVEMSLDNLPKELDGYTIVQLTDIHAGAINGPRFVQKNVEIANSLNPDMIVITGDLYDGTGTQRFDELITPIEKLKAKYGTFFITGNHEKYIGFNKTVTGVKSHGVRVLRGEVVDAGGVQIVGIDNPKAEMQKSNPEVLKLADKIDKNKPSVLLYHIPLGMADAKKAGIDIQLSGHTHGGQIWPFGLLEIPFYPVVSGYGVVEGLQLYVSEGSGTWGPPMRVGTSAEITKIILRSD